ncbi:MAG: nicotinate-nucleotide adenylyltransferase [Bacteroidales bacterium]|nr:nicotinate-nucleotide adenylyltransferase [Candidatus Liminaster caballi]
MRIGIYSGSFNPVHIGHIALADYLVSEGFVDELWLIRSPQNPLKPASGLMDDDVRLHILQIAIEGHPSLRICDIEDHLPRPSYTFVTLNELHRRYPEHDFYLVIGADNWLIFDHWREWETILSDFHVIVYPRPGYPLPVIDKHLYPTVTVADAPQYDISSTEIRQRLSQGESLDGLVDPLVAQALTSQALQFPH